MSDQQQLHPTNLFSTQTIGRTPEPCVVPMIYQPHTNPRLDGVNFHANIAHLQNTPFYPVLPIRTADPLLLRHVPQSMLCAYGPTMVDAPMHGHMPNSTPDYGHVMPQSSFHHQLPYSHVSQNVQVQPSTTTSLHRPVPISAATIPQVQPTKPREKRPLVVLHPVTGIAVNLESTSDAESAGPAESGPKVMVDKHDTTEATASPDLHELETPDSDHLPTVDTKITTECSLTVPTLGPRDDCVDISTHPDMATVFVKHVPYDAEVAACDPTVRPPLVVESADESLESDESDTDEVPFRRRYSRETLLSLKLAPVSKISLPNLVVISNISGNWKYRRGPNRMPQRIIKLPTGITVKTVEGAFVPTSLRKNVGVADNDKPKVLSRELNVILNRVSDGNLTETISDIRKLEFSSLDDVQLLSKLVFQKGIRQPKYSKVFATLCKELKGFGVPGSETFESLVLQQVKELFHTPLDTLISDLNVAIDAKIAAAKDEAVKRILDEDRETSILKKKEAYDGNMTLLAELFLCQLVPVKTVGECLKKLRESTAPEAVRSMIIILQTCGSELEAQAKNCVEACFSRLNLLVTSNKLPTHQVFKIQELCDLRDRGWKELTHNQGSLAQQLPASRWPAEDKIRRPLAPVASETKRRSVQSVNPVTPAHLAVTQQPQDSLKLGPYKANWASGSGLLKSDDSNHSQDLKSPPHAIPSIRSRESSPLVPSGPQGVWAQRKSASQATVVENTRPTENHESILKRCRGLARTTVLLLSSREDNVVTPVEECSAEHRSSLLRFVFEILMDKSPDERSAAGELCLRLLNQKLITSTDVTSACHAYFSTLDDDWLEDYPFGWKYLGEIFQHLIQNGPDYFHLLIPALQSLRSGGRGANVLAHCLKMSADRIGPDIVSYKYQYTPPDWSKLGISAGDVPSFLRERSISFVTQPNPFLEVLERIKNLAQSSSTSFDQLNLLFKQIPQSGLPYGFIRHCTVALVTGIKALSRHSIDQRVLALGLLVDHNPEHESQVLQALEECSKTVSPEEWQRSLLDKNVISSEAMKSWINSTDCKRPISKNFPMSE